MLQQKKQIFAVVPLGKKMQDGKALYGIQLRLNGLQRTEQVWKSIHEYCELQKQISTIAFDFDCNLQNNISKAISQQQKLKLIVEFVNQCKSRPDITNLITFRQFCQLSEVQQEYLSQWNRVNIGVDQMSVIGLAWDANNELLVSLHKPKSKVKLITNFFKDLLHKQTKLGVLKIHRFNKQWGCISEIVLQAQPLQLLLSSKSGMLLVSTAIGIYVYTLIKQADNFKQDLIDFIKIYDAKDIKYAAKTGNIYIATPQKVYVHSINKQFTMQISSQKFNNATAVQINKNQTRLYCSQSQHLKIYDITQTKAIKQLANISLSDNFYRLISQADKYLFGISKAGYISVFQIKPPGKQRLMSKLTSIDCPADMPIFAFNQRHQMIITSNSQYIVLISTKNVPLFAGGSHKSPITAGLYDTQSNLVITADQQGNLVFYNLSFLNVE